MKPLGIILIVLCIAAFAGVIYVYAVSSLSVSYMDCIATDPVTQLDFFNAMKAQLLDGTFVGTRFSDAEIASPDQLLYYTWTVRLNNATFLTADAAEIQIVPMSGDILQIGDPSEHTVPSGRSLELSATVLTSRSMHSIREAIVTWYFWGLPFSARVTLGR